MRAWVLPPCRPSSTSQVQWLGQGKPGHVHTWARAPSTPHGPTPHSPCAFPGPPLGPCPRPSTCRAQGETNALQRPGVAGERAQPLPTSCAGLRAQELGTARGRHSLGGGPHPRVGNRLEEAESRGGHNLQGRRAQEGTSWVGGGAQPTTGVHSPGVGAHSAGGTAWGRQSRRGAQSTGQAQPGKGSGDSPGVTARPLQTTGRHPSTLCLCSLHT